MSQINTSLWVQTAKRVPTFPKLQGDGGRFDVAVIGGGIFGLSTAMTLTERGKSVAVLEGARVGSGVSGYTTAKLSSLHNLTYHQLAKKFGVEATRHYAALNEAGLEQIARHVRERDIDCAFVRTDNYTYCLQAKTVAALRAEAEAASEAGLQASFGEGTPEGLPFEALAYVRVPHQARFNSYAYCCGLAEALREAGAHVYEDTRVVRVEAGGGGGGGGDEEAHDKHRLRTANGASLRADNVVIATHIPITDRSGHFGFLLPVTSYCLAFRAADGGEGSSSAARGAASLHGMFINPDEPSLSLRAAEDEEGRRVVVVAGSSHSLGEPPTGDTEDCYRAVEELARRMVPGLGALVCRWTGEDFMPADGVPYIGYLHRGTKSLFTATGFKKWGLAASAGAALLVADLITGEANPWHSLFDARRWDLAGSSINLLKEQLKVSKHFLGDRVKDLVVPDIEDLGLDKGGICRMHGRAVAGYRDRDGMLHAVSPNCTHMGCHVRWNQGDRTWDCPCHGSRFDVNGAVIHGPGVAPLEQYVIE